MYGKFILSMATYPQYYFMGSAYTIYPFMVAFNSVPPV